MSDLHSKFLAKRLGQVLAENRRIAELCNSMAKDIETIIALGEQGELTAAFYRLARLADELRAIQK